MLFFPYLWTRKFSESRILFLLRSSTLKNEGSGNLFLIFVSLISTNEKMIKDSLRLSYLQKQKT